MPLRDIHQCKLDVPEPKLTLIHVIPEESGRTALEHGLFYISEVEFPGESDLRFNVFQPLEQFLHVSGGRIRSETLGAIPANKKVQMRNFKALSLSSFKKESFKIPGKIN